jgi:hypothetical protein
LFIHDADSFQKHGWDGLLILTMSRWDRLAVIAAASHAVVASACCDIVRTENAFHTQDKSFYSSAVCLQQFHIIIPVVSVKVAISVLVHSLQLKIIVNIS